ncbi:hypothetical protein SARC_13156 [Sphaeroforma arctica JP610]|uniref:Alcohol dehydrogenase-like N-terminal domain-containing protein n=1 Tax=Sphaeroforma arctica JP610 TaxID=667725 RepID=A0A0L0FDZ9_9EUKA|nr:hypothetical protein SARC_13156 [Sphaeroforma arctica JP610]KNC74293.1 hypothetical protein SARC_13156 [Sphaeroforma arctica JP610]|eukprot:XP_014148195.1 hypothetical protein SARC_13156 [Sphaeroforma arctica JP610]
MVGQEANNVTQAWVVPSKGAALELQTIVMQDMTPTQVQVDVKFVGLCGTDLHMRDNDWGITQYPMVMGHEGVGVVTHIGERVNGLKVGDHIGIGWIRDSCGSCRSCMMGKDNLCEKGYQGTYLASGAGCWGKDDASMKGCFAKQMRIEEKFAFKLEESMNLERVAPLMCGGITVWEPIVDYVKPGTHVGVRSLGGLGNLKHKHKKEEQAREWGAKHFVATESEEEMKSTAGSLDLILDTCLYAPENGDMSPWIDLLCFGGTYCRLGLPEVSTATFNYVSLHS